MHNKLIHVFSYYHLYKNYYGKKVNMKLDNFLGKTWYGLDTSVPRHWFEKHCFRAFRIIVVSCYLPSVNVFIKQHFLINSQFSAKIEFNLVTHRKLGVFQKVTSLEISMTLYCIYVKILS